MKVISHRGNLNGKSELENNPIHINECLLKEIECEIDVWKIEDEFYLGHDKPMYKIEESFLAKEGLWLHCKNLDALDALMKKNVNCFWHQNDDFTLTSKGFIWTFPNKQVKKNSVIVDNDPKWVNKKYDCYAICTDYYLI